MGQKILVTGGAGYIGSHACLELLSEGHEVIVVDNLLNSSEKSLEVVEDLSKKKVSFHQVDLMDKKALEGVFKQYKIDAVIHFAGLKAVGESTENPLFYYQNNLIGTLCLLEVMKEQGVNQLIFSSSATVYGLTDQVPLVEGLPTSATNPYGWTKYMIEQILRDVCAAQEDLHVILLRYFNPVGAHKSGRMGEDPRGRPNNLMPYITQVAVGHLKELNVWGNDYNTPDGTGVRDYIHVVDLVLGHIKALNHLKDEPGCRVYNLGTGQGYSVLEVIDAFEKASGLKVPYRLAPRRTGDVAQSYGDASLALKELGWKAEKTLSDMCEDSWRWQKSHPKGYA